MWLLVGGVMGGVQNYFKRHCNSFRSVKRPCFPFVMWFWLISLISEPIHVVSLKISLIWSFEQARGCLATWMPCALYVWKMSIFGLLNGLDLLHIHWSYLIYCALHCGKGIYHGDFIITCYWIIFIGLTWRFIMFIGWHVSWNIIQNITSNNHDKK